MNVGVNERPSLHLTSITVSCPAPRALADFYARLLGATLTASEPPLPDEPPEAGWAQLAAGALTVNFEYERHWTPPVWPAEQGRQTATQHFDIHVHDLDAATQWAVECGARVASVQPQEDVRVLFDPAGHPFCLFT
ncbi:MAG: VOC family protein [Propionibacteriaceae bacterium]|jgi:catechol 2,3-dioxygenase-like lactoylglutathione lyase family enzyme|nr:VOC family protein [Propionibacteriaceae bacterium]